MTNFQNNHPTHKNPSQTVRSPSLIHPTHNPSIHPSPSGSPQTSLLPSPSAPPTLPFTPPPSFVGQLEKLGFTSNAGFRSKKFLGLNSTLTGSAGIIGQSSGLGTCVKPNVCQSTTSCSSIVLSGSSAIHAIKSAFCALGSPLVCGTCRPAGCNWSSAYAVTWIAWRAKPARFQTREPSLGSKGGASREMSL